MRKKSKLINKILLAFIIFFAILGFMLYKNADQKAIESAHPHALQDITVYFCPEDCKDINSNFEDINSLFCAIYDIEFPWFWNKARILYDSNKEVIIVTDNDQFYKNFTKMDPSTLEDVNYLYFKGVIVTDKKSAYMHNKICVLDDKLLIGSKNFNKTSNYDNFLVIKDANLANIAKLEILEMYSGIFGGGEPSPIQKGDIELYFCPEDSCESKYLTELKKAKERIHCEFFSMTLNSLSQLMLTQAKSGVDLKVLFEKSQINQYSQFAALANYSKKNTTGYIHNKFCIIDDTVITGSMNPSKNSNTQNDESIIIIHNPQIADIYENKFQQQWYKLTK